MSEKFILLLLCILGLLSIWPLIMGFYLIPLIVLEGLPYGSFFANIWWFMYTSCICGPQFLLGTFCKSLFVCERKKKKYETKRD